MASKKAIDLINTYARVKKQHPANIVRHYDALKGTTAKSKFLKSIKDELIRARGLKAKGKSPAELEKEAQLWYRRILRKAKDAGATKLQVGRFYHYTYRSDYYPDLLAFYDTKPLIFLFDMQRKKGKSYLLGINFHWLSRSARVKLLNAMYKTYPKEFEEDKPIPLKYPDIKTLSKYKQAYIIIRKYIRGNIKRKIVRIPNLEMLNVINLRSEKFTGITPEMAWELSSIKTTEVFEKKIKRDQLIKKHGATKGMKLYRQWYKKRQFKT